MIQNVIVRNRLEKAKCRIHIAKKTFIFLCNTQNHTKLLFLNQMYFGFWGERNSINNDKTQHHNYHELLLFSSILFFPKSCLISNT
jgi:hypothetical protein